MDTSDEEDLALLLLATSERDGIRCTKIEQVRFPLYYTIRSYTAFPNSTLLCEPVLGNPIVRFKLFACPRKRASYTRIVYSYVNSALRYICILLCPVLSYLYTTLIRPSAQANTHAHTHIYTLNRTSNSTSQAYDRTEPLLKVKISTALFSFHGVH